MLKEVKGVSGQSITDAVLILILMEHAQRARKAFFCPMMRLSLNPYFNGTCSKRKGVNVHKITSLPVLILILMEHAQRVS